MELNTLEQTKAQLMATSEDFRKMAAEHADYKRRLEELGALDHLSLEQEAEEHRLKKLKLHLKDQMTGMLSNQGFQSVS